MLATLLMFLFGGDLIALHVAQCDMLIKTNDEGSVYVKWTCGK